MVFGLSGLWKASDSRASAILSSLIFVSGTFFSGRATEFLVFCFVFNFLTLPCLLLEEKDVLNVGYESGYHLRSEGYPIQQVLILLNSENDIPIYPLNPRVGPQILLT